MRRYRCCLLAFLALAAFSCALQEDTVPCVNGEARFHFRYTYNTSGTDLFQSSVGALWLYLFDESTGILLDVFQVPPEALSEGLLEAELPVGRYTMAVWGTGMSSKSLDQMGFQQVHMTDSQQHTYKDIEVGSTTLNDFRMMLSDPGYFEELFFGLSEHVAIEPREDASRVDFDLVRYNNRLNVTLSGYHHLLDEASLSGATRSGEESPLDIHVTGRKGTYLHNGAIDPLSPELRYEERLQSLSATDTEVDIELLHLDMGHHTTENPVLLHLHHRATETDLIPELDVLDLIRQVRDREGKYVYATQEDIDREEVFRIEIHVMQDLRVSIKVCDFTIEELDPIIGPR